MRVVIDTNVLASGIFFNGPPHEILRKFNDGSFSLVISHEILGEYKRVIGDLAETYKAIDGLHALDSIILKAELTLAIHLPMQICADPTDDKFIAAAISSKAKRIVSGDKHLLKFPEYQGIKIITPRTFLDEIK